MRDPETGHRLGGRQHAARNQLAADPKDEATTKSGPAATAAGDEPAAKKKPAAKNEPSAKNGPAAKNGPTARNGSAARNQPAGRARK
jgi:hypothetical protein